jgi:hypothetical protein
MKKYLIIGGTHGNEPLGVGVCKKLEALKIINLSVLYANEQAIKQNKRFINQDLNRVFPGSPKGSYEVKRAQEIINISKSFDYVIDFHNTNCPNNNCGFVGGNKWQKAVNLSLFLGLKRVIVADYDCINKYVKNCLSVEISLQSKKSNVDYWIRKILNLKNFDPDKTYGRPDLYKFSYRVTRNQQNQYNFKKWLAFKPVPTKDLRKLDLSGKYYPIFIDDQYTPYNYAGLISEIIK